jgi:hypothetical protein
MSSQRVKKRESKIAYASSRIRPFPLAALLQATRANETFPTKVHLRKQGRQNNTTAETNNKCFNLHLNVLNKQMFIT